MVIFKLHYSDILYSVLSSCYFLGFAAVVTVVGRDVDKTGNVSFAKENIEKQALGLLLKCYWLFF